MCNTQVEEKIAELKIEDTTPEKHEGIFISSRAIILFIVNRSENQ